MRMQIRCCCDCRLMGTIEAEPGMDLGHMLRFPVFGAVTIELEVAYFMEHGSKSLALKSNDYPIELLKLIPGFQETTSTNTPQPHSSRLYQLVQHPEGSSERLQVVESSNSELIEPGPFVASILLPKV